MHGAWPLAAYPGVAWKDGRHDHQRMVRDLNMDLEIVGMPIVREADGLAMSSRNAYLSPVERQGAQCLSRAIYKARDLYAVGVKDVTTLRSAALDLICSEAVVTLDYLDFRDGATLETVEQANDDTLMALAVKTGATRLIDNTLLGEGL